MQQCSVRAGWAHSARNKAGSNRHIRLPRTLVPEALCPRLHRAALGCPPASCSGRGSMGRGLSTSGLFKSLLQFATWASGHRPGGSPDRPPGFGDASSSVTSYPCSARCFRAPKPADATKRARQPQQFCLAETPLLQPSKHCLHSGCQWHDLLQQHAATGIVR